MPILPDPIVYGAVVRPYYFRAWPISSTLAAAAETANPLQAIVSLNALTMSKR